jgi:hypothetical protein
MGWIREIAGWLLIVVALYLIRTALQFAMDLETPRIFEAAVTMLGGLGVLKAGVLVVRIATAARVCRLDVS